MSAAPIIPGFHPDPSICRVGDDYYLVTSSFEYLPGVPIFHSRDLVSWRLIGNVLDREDQLSLRSSAGSGGIFAPTLRQHDGVFYLITTNINRAQDGHLIVAATNPAGPWSTPVYTAGAVGIDPDLFWDDDGTCYLSWAVFGGEVPIMQARIDPTTGTLLSSPHPLSRGIGLAHPEGPHLFRRGDWYYLLLAEGGTERGHTVTIHRSTSARGPFEPHPSNPILSHRSTTHPVQNTGHADLVETDDGWAMVFLGVRPVGPTPGFHVLGRETFIAGVRWHDHWPVVDAAAFDVPAWPSDLDDTFGQPLLGPRWVAPGRHPQVFVSPVDDGGVSIAAPTTRDDRSLLAIRIEDQSWQAEATIDAGTGRLVLRLDDNHWVAVESADGAISARAVVGPFDQVLGVGAASPEASPANTVTLAIRALPPTTEPFAAESDILELGHIDAEEFIRLGSLDGRYLSTEVAGGFTGRVVGVEPHVSAGSPTVGGATGQPAVLRRFAYRAL